MRARAKPEAKDLAPTAVPPAASGRTRRTLQALLAFGVILVVAGGLVVADVRVGGDLASATKVARPPSHRALEHLAHLMGSKMAERLPRSSAPSLGKRRREKLHADVARPTPKPCEASTEQATVELTLELVARVLGHLDIERAIINGAVQRLEVVSHHSIERRLLRAMTLVTTRRAVDARCTHPPLREPRARIFSADGGNVFVWIELETDPALVLSAAAGTPGAAEGGEQMRF